MSDQDKFGKFTRGNRAWKRRIHENFKKIKKPEELMAMVCEYFQWLEDNPLMEGQIKSFEGSHTIEELPKMRAPTLAGLCAHLGIHRDTWGAWRRGERCPEFATVVEWTEQIMYDEKFTGAAAGLLNPMIIVRDLGLSEKNELTGANGGAIQTEDVTKRDADEFTRSISRLAAAAREGSPDSEA